MVCLVLYSAESSLSDRSKRFTLYNLTYLFIPTLTRLLWKAFSLMQILREDYSLTFLHVNNTRLYQVILHGGDSEFSFFMNFHSVHREAQFAICLLL